MKKTILFLLVILLVIGACGCMFGEKRVTIEDELVQYMNQKYTDDTFTYKKPTGGGAGADSKTIVVSSAKYPDQDIYVRKMLNGTSEFIDNYLSVKYADQTEALIANVLDNVLTCEYFLIYDVERYACPNKSGEMSFEEYISKKESCIGFTVVAKNAVENANLFEQMLEKAIVEAGLCCRGTVYFDNGSGGFDMLKEKGLSGYTFKKLYSAEFSFEMDTNKGFSSSNWGE